MIDLIKIYNHQFEAYRLNKSLNYTLYRAKFNFCIVYLKFSIRKNFPGKKSQNKIIRKINHKRFSLSLCLDKSQELEKEISRDEASATRWNGTTFTDVTRYNSRASIALAVGKAAPQGCADCVSFAAVSQSSSDENACHRSRVFCFSQSNMIVPVALSRSTSRPYLGVIGHNVTD